MQDFSLCCLPLNMATPWLREKSMHIHLHLHMHLHKSRHIYDLNERQLILIFLFPSLLFFNPPCFSVVEDSFSPPSVSPCVVKLRNQQCLASGVCVWRSPRGLEMQFLHGSRRALGAALGVLATSWHCWFMAPLNTLFHWRLWVYYGWSFHVLLNKNLSVLHWQLFTGWPLCNVP